MGNLKAGHGMAISECLILRLFQTLAPCQDFKFAIIRWSIILLVTSKSSNFFTMTVT